MKLRALIVAGLLLLLAGPGCALCRLGPCARSPEAEALAGARAACLLEARYGGTLADEAAQQRMATLGNALAEASRLPLVDSEFALLDTPSRNAFSLPPNRVYLTRGLYDRLQTDDQLAGVIAHEFAHLLVRDHFKPAACTCDEVLAREVAADRRGVDLLCAAGYESEALVEVVHIVADCQPAGWADIRAGCIHAHRPRPPHLLTTPAAQVASAAP